MQVLQETVAAGTVKKRFSSELCKLEHEGEFGIEILEKTLMRQIWCFASTSSSGIDCLTHCPELRIIKCRLGHGAHSIDVKTSSLRACHFIGLRLHMKIKMLLYTVGTAWNYTDVRTEKNNTTVYMTDTSNMSPGFHCLSSSSILLLALEMPWNHRPE